MSKSEHFTAIIEIKQVEPPLTMGSGEKKITDISRLVLRADSLEKLVSKAGAHLALIEE